MVAPSLAQLGLLLLLTASVVVDQVQVLVSSTRVAQFQNLGRLVRLTLVAGYIVGQRGS